MRINNKTNSKKANTSVSKSADKKSDVLIKIDELMGNLEGEYGPLMIEELQNRLMKTIVDFQEDLKIVLQSTFNQHNDRYKETHDSAKSDNSEDNQEMDMPSYIADYEKKK